jgi:hypothetical protein
MLTMYHGIPHTLSFFALRVRKIDGLYSGMLDVSSLLSLCLIDALCVSPSESRYTQQITLKVSPVQTNYSPDGRSLLYTSAGHQLFFMTFGRETETDKEQWTLSDKDGVCTISSFHYIRASLTTDDSAYCSLHGNVQSYRRWCRYDASSRTHYPYYGLSISHRA